MDGCPILSTPGVTVTRRALLGGLVAGGLATPALAQSAFPLTVTDIAGRGVTLARPPRRILLAEGVQFASLALLDPEIASRLALIGEDSQRYDPGTFAALLALYPDLARIPTIADLGSEGLEAALMARPDLVLLSLWQKDTAAAALAQFAALAIPVVFTDFFVSPLQNTGPSMRLLGQLLGRSSAGAAYAAFHAQHLARVTSLIAAAPRPRVLLQAYPGLWACCWSAGRSGFGEFIARAGATNVGAAQFPNEFGGTLSLEFVLAANPDAYIATGLSNTGIRNGIIIGPGIAADVARDSLKRVMAGPDVSAIPAARKGAGYALWNYFNGSPLNILAIEAMAGWFHPAITASAGISAEASLAEIRDRFLKTNLTGTLWVAA